MIITDRNSSAYRSKLRDGILTMPRAGKRIPTGDTAKACLQEIPRPPTPLVVKKYTNSNQPGPGVIRVHYGKVNDPDIENTLVHGVRTKGSQYSGSLINPPRKTFYQQRFHEISEAVYASRQRAPLGRSHDQSTGLPSWFNDKTTFGVKTVSDICAGDLINPPKSAAQVEIEAQTGHQAYIKTHNDYFVGERVDRNYNWSVYSKDRHFGVSTPHFNKGSNVARSLPWLYDMQNDNNTTFVSKASGEQKLNVPPEHIFGILTHTDDHGAGELIHCDDPGLYQKDNEQQLSLVNTVRHQLKKVNFHSFSCLLQAFRHYDKKGKGVIDKEDIREVCRQFKLDLDEPILNDLMDYCDVNKDGLINFLEFANFLNWKDKMPINTWEQTLLTKHRIGTCPANIQRKPALVESIQSGGQPEIQPCEQVLIQPEDLVPLEPGSSLKTPRTLRRPRTAPDNFVTSSSLIRAIVGGPPPIDSCTYGIPTVRTDLPAPLLRCISDTTNYGWGTTASNLLSPPLPSLWGVHREHYFSPRTKKEIADIFRNVGVHLSEETFEQVWKLASMRSPTGEVCVEIFRDILKEIKAM